jgi:hypothetical protein
MKDVKESGRSGFGFQLAGHAFRVDEADMPGVDNGPAQRTQQVTIDGTPFGMWPFEAGESRDQMVARVVREFRARSHK